MLPLGIITISWQIKELSYRDRYILNQTKKGSQIHCEPFFFEIVELQIYLLFIIYEAS